MMHCPLIYHLTASDVVWLRAEELELTLRNGFMACAFILYLLQVYRRACCRFL